MADLFNQFGNFLFHTRNILFPSLIIAAILLWPPVPIDHIPGNYFLITGLVIIALGQGLRILTIGLAYIVRGGQNRRIYAEKLVTDGVFSHCRNPLYLGNLLIISGFLFVSGNITGIILGSLCFMVIYRLIIHSEETFLSRKFPAAYPAYCHDVPRWIPELKGLQNTIAQYRFDWPAVAVKEYGTLLTSLMTPLGLIGWKLNLANKLDEYQTLILGLTVVILSVYGIVRFLKKSERLRSLR